MELMELLANTYQPCQLHQPYQPTVKSKGNNAKTNSKLNEINCHETAIFLLPCIGYPILRDGAI